MVLADAGKFGTHAFSVFARCHELDAVVTDGRPEQYPFLKSLEVEIITAQAAETPDDSRAFADTAPGTERTEEER
jgi:hypothetical protein